MAWRNQLKNVALELRFCFSAEYVTATIAAAR